MHLWVEAMKTTAYMQNKSPHKVLENKTPKEMFSREKPEVNHFIIFDYPVFIHIPKEKTSNLDPSRWRTYFLVTVTYRGITGYTFLIIEKWRS
jgi:hypothetical protein